MLREALHDSRWVAAIISWCRGLRLHGTHRSNVLHFHNARFARTRIEIFGTNCRITIGPETRLWDCLITLVGDNVELFIGADCRLRKIRIAVEDSGSRLMIGNLTSMTGTTLVSQEGRLLQIGEDCMIAQHSELRNSDSHAIYHAEAPELRTNPAADVIIGDHVWIGLGSYVFKGANIADGAIIGARSIVTGDIPSACLAWGVPATPRQHDVIWKRERNGPRSTG
jgi:acetyltransferase-like isoleucine patch superfamily enzyme